MTSLRVHPTLAHEPSSAPCAHCLLVVAIEAGDWHAVALEGPGQAVCDHCARTQDAAGFEQVEAWRRMAGPQRCRCNRPWPASDGHCAKCGRAT